MCLKMKTKKLCTDDLVGGYFYTREDHIEMAILSMYSLIEEYGFASFNKWLNLLGLKDIPNGNKLGWNKYTRPFNVVYANTILPDGRNCLTISHKSHLPGFDYI